MSLYDFDVITDDPPVRRLARMPAAPHPAPVTEPIAPLDPASDDRYRTRPVTDPGACP